MVGSIMLGISISITGFFENVPVLRIIIGLLEKVHVRSNRHRPLEERIVRHIPEFR